MPQRSRWVLPDTPEPESTRCFLIEIPDDPQYLAAFRGAVYELSKPYAWQNDDDHTAITVGARMWTAYSTIREVDCGVGDLQLRLCETGCGIEYSTDGETWTCLDLGACIENIWDEKLAQAFDDGVLGQKGLQPGPSDAPEPETCQSFHVVLKGNDQWHSPFAVNDGYTIQVTNAKGGWGDGSLAWYCPNGDRYLLGACSNVLHSHEDGDPSAEDWHMQIVGNFGETWFDPMDGLYTIPPSTGATDFILQANDGSLADNLGEIEFDVEICRPTNEWVHIFDFSVSNQSFSAYNCGMTGFCGVSYGSFGGSGNEWGAASTFGIYVAIPEGSDATVTSWSVTGTFQPRAMHLQAGLHEWGSPDWDVTDQTGIEGVLTGGHQLNLYCIDGAGVSVATLELHGSGSDPWA